MTKIVECIFDTFECDLIKALKSVISNIREDKRSVVFTLKQTLLGVEMTFAEALFLCRNVATTLTMQAFLIFQILDKPDELKTSQNQFWKVILLVKKPRLLWILGNIFIICLKSLT
jgi:hypothetical protein